MLEFTKWYWNNLEKLKEHTPTSSEKYEEIKDRKGETIDRVSIKDEETIKADKPCPACVGCTLDDGEPNILRYPCIEAYRDYIVPGEGENTEKFVKEYLDVYYCPSCGRRIRND